MQARNKFSIAIRCLLNALTTGVPGGTKGAFNIKLKMDKTALKGANSFISPARYSMRVINSVRMTKSKISGEAKRESSQVLYNEIV